MSYVTYRPIGRLGNHLFQMAACIGYAKKHGMQWGCPSNTYEVPEFHKWFPGLPKAPLVSQRYNAHDPSTFGYNEIPHFEHGVTLVGFFQSLKYFENAQEEVKKAINLKYVDGYQDYVSIHVRRGDYVQHANSFPPVTADYVYQALSKIQGKTKCIIFSDDIEWCKKEFGNLFEYSERRNTYDDLCLMASCGHHIIANSTYSWWAAFLGRNPNKIIVSPDCTSWFGVNGPKNTQDLIPDNWIQIKFR